MTRSLQRRKESPPSRGTVMDGAPPGHKEVVEEFAVLYRMAYPIAIRNAERSLGEEEAKDAVNDAALKQFQRWNDPPPHRRTLGFFLRAARDQVIDTVRRAGRQPEGALGTALPSGSAPLPDALRVPSPEGAVELLDELERARRIVGTFPPRRHEVFVLCREEGLSPAEAAVVLGISPKTVQRHLDESVDALRAAVARDERRALRVSAGLDAPNREAADA